ncbi:uncharacterized protein EI90DRAFT_3075017 [Cantharellus anzutake]|uniref:uncharacterized protein n=1 Tax=Cantharellus anzutake TaxID=1750568 RepID=UPI0019065E1B|nr:uncharacterized protein EI90DRAFT_3075017 [Cantharellus anzutake]KAF8324546.1 hypothetical protein EI90DRAFT_3075017 [Cantharellus anzutake]
MAVASAGGVLLSSPTCSLSLWCELLPRSRSSTDRLSHLVVHSALISLSTLHLPQLLLSCLVVLEHSCSGLCIGTGNGEIPSAL